MWGFERGAGWRVYNVPSWSCLTTWFFVIETALGSVISLKMKDEAE